MLQDVAQKIAIVGVAFRFPGDVGDECDFWRALLDGRDLVTQIDPSRWATNELQHPMRGEAGRSVTFSAGVLSRIDEFDAGFFGISPREAAWLDPQQRLLLELAWEAMENGGMPPSLIAGSDCAVYVGISGLDYGIRGLDDLASMSAHTMTGNTLSIAANRLSYVFDLHGPSMAIDTACSSSLVALHQACNALRVGDAAMAMVGGVNMLTHPYPFIGFSKASMLSAGGRCQSFDASGDGYVRAEGGAVLLLKPLDRAVADGDRIHAVILASGANADGGRKTGLTIPSIPGQVELMRSVLARAGIAAEDVDYLEAHGTGTSIGDPIEAAAIGAVYGQARPRSRPLPIGSVKSNLGHLEPASGMAGLVKALLVLKHGEVPPSIHLEKPNPKIDFANWNLLPVNEQLSLVHETERPRIVGVNSFGFGGANGHVLLQQYSASTAAKSCFTASKALPPLVLSARSEAALRELAGRYAKLLATETAVDYYDLAYAAAYRRERLDKRLAVAFDSPAALRDRLSRFAAGEAPAGLVVEDAPAEAGKLAFIYAGNGTQWAGMGQLLLAESETFRAVLEDVSARIAALTGLSVIDQLQVDAALSRMADTAVAQPLLFAVQVAVTVMLREQGIEADVVAGHSVGEIAAAWAAGALSLDEAVRIICARSNAQALTGGAGRMAAMSMSEADMRALLAETEELPDIEIAGINSPGNVTLSGPLEQFLLLTVLAKRRGIAFRMLDLDYAFHSRCMDPIKEILSRSLTGLAPVNVPGSIFISTVTGDVFDAPLDAAYWWDNIRQPVRFEPAIKQMIALGCRTFVEISPHAILQRYLKECLAAGDTKGQVLPSLRKNDDGIDRVEELALRLHLLSGRDTLQGFFPAVGRFVDLPSYPWQRERHWLPATSEGYRLIERSRIHPLLGWPLKDAQAGWENVLDPRAQPWLADHCVGGSIVLPGAAYVEMALAAAREWFAGETQELEELDIIAPVVFDGEHGRSIRFDLNPRDGSFQIRSRQRLSDDEWALNACGRLLGAVTGYTEGPAQAWSEGGEVLDHDTHYRLAHALGLDYGPVFQGMAEAHVAGDRLEGIFAAPVGLDTEPWLLHPAIVDVCFQSLLDFFRSEIEAGVCLPLLPVKVGRLRLLRTVPITSFRTRILRRSLRSVLAEFELLAVDGKKVAILSGCRFRAASLRQSKHVEPACWEIQPVVQPGTLASAKSALPTVHALAQQIKDWFIDQESELKRRAYFGETQPLFDALVTAFAHQAMQSLIVGQPANAQNWLDDTGNLNDQHRQLISWVRDLLVEQNYLVRGEAGWTLADSDMPPAAEIWRTLLADYPEGMSELVLIGRMGRALAPILAGQLDPAALTVEMRRSHQLETLFDNSITYRGTRLAVEQLLEGLVRQLPSNGRLRILEISAGLSEVPRQLGHRVDTGAVDYVLAHADLEACDHLRHEYQSLDWIAIAELETAPPMLKGKARLPANYDVVIFRHSLNRLADSRAMLAWAQGQLASGGLLVLAERYADLAADLVCGAKRLPPPQVWQDELANLGFNNITICREPAGEGSQVGAYLLLAKGSEYTATEAFPEAARWLLLAGDASSADMAQVLQQTMLSRGQVAVCICFGESLRSRDDAINLLVRQQQEFDGAIDHVLLLAGERGPDDTTLPVEALNLVQALTSSSQFPQLSFVTQGGVPVDGLLDANRCNPAHAALWGFGRVVMNEYPGLACKLIDLPATDKTSVLAELLVDELLYPDGESEVILQPAGRHVLRMGKASLAIAGSQGQGGQRYRLDFRVPGQLRNLLWLEQPERELAADEIEVRPLAAGLNFRDIMYVMGLLPDEAVEHGFAGASLGLEFAGVVTRIGSRVEEYVPGDAVMGFGSACFASHVVTRANAVTPKPEAWSFEAAATVPTVFFTVYYALKQLANLQPGERVLIHGAAGGVGIAAIQLARHLGAEVFATAGSAEKREFVALLGADHVFDSRSLAYADQILAATGGEGVDVVLNSLAGEAIRRNLHVLRPFGRFLELGKRDFFENTPIGLRPFKDNISYFGIDADQLLTARPDLAGRLFREVMALFRTTVLWPLPARVFPAERVVDAFRFMQQARQIGKVVVSFEGAKIVPQALLPVQGGGRVGDGFDSKGSYLVTGGISGFGLETARWLARHGAGQLVLLSRRGAETPGADAAVASIQALGAQVIVLACDVTDRHSLVQAIQHEGLRPLKGVFHAAMVIDDALMINLDPERMARVLAPKIKGAWNLHELSRELPLDHFMLYSSVTTSLGNPGQANYVAANTWLEGLAVLRRALGLPVTCIGWGPIGDAGYLTRNQAVKDALSSRLGADPLSAEGALRMLGRALAAAQPNLAIADFQWSALARLLPSAQGPRFAALRRHGDESSNSAENLDDFRALIEGKSPAELKGLVAQLVTHEVAEILGVSAERIDPARSLHDLGLDSLMGVELALGLEKRFGINVPAMMLNEGPSVERVTARILERLAAGDAASEEGGDLAAMASSMAVQHGESVPHEVIDAAVAEIEKEQANV